ncbi:precorrin-6A synthase [Devosia subaequoris]|uniref:Precorrin-6A synthase [deacetylating] n=1 Tax=Devosia subaequoris TaxID=395930 RepID=A0A7W6NA59_9HYPH|nr:precorrin-6A synthase (deacetylating) [Devosia subaequoris]MBB4051159.1 precorrin-6A synthase [Devosia subaequoris]MCP1208176.1 precorrin-6A synthase (deacetylating) [Devosia subaequoris]
MKTIYVVGIGTGSAEHVTIAAIDALNRADVLFIPDKGASKSDLADVRRNIIARHVLKPEPRQIGYAVPRRDAQHIDYGQGVADWHRALADIYAMLICDVPENGAGAFLVWGDPGLYDSTLRILAHVTEPIRVEVIPGITAVQALTAAHGIALNRIGEPVLITPGRKLGAITTDTVVMLDGQMAFRDADPKLEIFWGAYLGTPDQILIAGRLGAVCETIINTRILARERHGWIMDTYLLRQPE